MLVKRIERMLKPKTDKDPIRYEEDWIKRNMRRSGSLVTRSLRSRKVTIR